MASKDTTASAAPPSTSPFFFNWDRERGEAALNLQKTIMESYEHASRMWLERLQSEIAMWSDMAGKLSATKTFPEALETYSNAFHSGCKWRPTMGAGFSTKLRTLRKESQGRSAMAGRAAAPDFGCK